MAATRSDEFKRDVARIALTSAPTGVSLHLIWIGPSTSRRVRAVAEGGQGSSDRTLTAAARSSPCPSIFPLTSAGEVGGLLPPWRPVPHVDDERRWW